MPHPLADEARALNDRQLAEAINEAYRELFNLQFQKGTRQLQDGTAIGRTRKQIARLRTVQRERQIAAVLGAPIEPIEAPAEAAISPQKQRALDERAALEAEEAAEAEADEAVDEGAGETAEDDASGASDEAPDDGDGPADDPDDEADAAEEETD